MAGGAKNIWEKGKQMSSRMQITLQAAEGVWGSPVRKGWPWWGMRFGASIHPLRPAAAGAEGAGSTLVVPPSPKPAWEGGG